MYETDSLISGMLPYLRSVSDGLSKLFWSLSSAIRSSLAANSSVVGNVIDIGGVTPHWRVGGVGAAIAMLLPGRDAEIGVITE